MSQHMIDLGCINHNDNDIGDNDNEKIIKKYVFFIFVLTHENCFYTVAWIYPSICEYLHININENWLKIKIYKYTDQLLKMLFSLGGKKATEVKLGKNTN